MGNICGKASDPDTSTAGRPLGSAPATTNAKPTASIPMTTHAATSTYGGVINPKPTASIPISQKQNKPKVTGPGRALGEPGGEGGSSRDARDAAARAAEVREQAFRTGSKGVLGSKLDAQKRQPARNPQQKVTDHATLAWD